MSSNPSIYTDLKIDEELDAIRQKEVDLVICDVLVSDISRTMLYENNGIRSVSPHYMGYSSFRISFSQVKKLAEIILSAFNSKPYKRDLIYFKYDYHKERFPTLISDIPDELRWERIMKHVWRGKERWALKKGRQKTSLLIKTYALTLLKAIPIKPDPKSNKLKLPGKGTGVRLTLSM